MEISEAEWEIMRVIWASQQSTSSSILDVLIQKKEWKISTVKTLLSRLVQKGFLQTDKVGNRFIYQATLTESEAIKNKLTHLLGQMCSKKIGSIFLEAIQWSELSQQDINQLMLVLQEKLVTAPAKVNCHCIKGQCTCDK